MKKAFIPLKRDSATYILEKKVKKIVSGFTLIEMVIVLVIIGILMGVTMRFSSSRISDLKAQSLKDMFVDAYTLVQSQNLASSYYGTLHYSLGKIIFDNETGIVVSYDDVQTQQLLSDTNAMKLQISGPAILSFTPYHMGCLLSRGTATGLSFGLEVNGNTKYCFSISPSTCTLKELSCVE